MNFALESVRNAITLSSRVASFTGWPDSGGNSSDISVTLGDTSTSNTTRLRFCDISHACIAGKRNTPARITYTNAHDNPSSAAHLREIDAVSLRYIQMTYVRPSRSTGTSTASHASPLTSWLPICHGSARRRSTNSVFVSFMRWPSVLEIQGSQFVQDQFLPAQFVRYPIPKYRFPFGYRESSGALRAPARR